MFFSHFNLQLNNLVKKNDEFCKLFLSIAFLAYSACQVIVFFFRKIKGIHTVKKNKKYKASAKCVCETV